MPEEVDGEQVIVWTILVLSGTTRPIPPLNFSQGCVFVPVLLRELDDFAKILLCKNCVIEPGETSLHDVLGFLNDLLQITDTADRLDFFAHRVPPIL